KKQAGWKARLSVGESMSATIARLWGLLLFLFVGSVEGVLESNEIFAGFERVEQGLLGFELLLRVIGGFDRKANAQIRFVYFDDTRRNFLADFEHVFDLFHAL